MTLLIDLSGRTAVVTGGGGGIGRAIAIRLAEAGAHVAIGDIVTERCEETAARIRESGREALAFPLDVMDDDQVRALVAAVDAQFGRVDILVNNAGGVSRRMFADQSQRSWQRHIDINFTSMLTATHAVIPIMRRGGQGGAIVGVSSMGGSRAAPGFAVYAACKAAMESFTKSMALELSADGIRVNCIAPDHTVTPGNRGNRSGPVDPTSWAQPSPQIEDAMCRAIPLGREGVDMECGDAVAFLCSDLASYITGVTLPVDGGTMAASGWHRGTRGNWTLAEGLNFD
ncbi:SDR family oxidoreductase [Sphingobium yanoikuyae]|jgi:NAD(P)-dependent dehydrogenase (short-subunit alcohol dehydrogenase family)|uniref:SDR family oxidoreductase n=1 Tax=Sphingobium yanoikuyae TaxID=13690 RepID=A0A6M4G7R0_SPHYA|nr:SDR family oxidoreductase [Sphingobium yanoikuyae]QJR02293.1 SDR family oxidoreductase [Sphingobium yanoikuyae]